jgi:hypothetical protein
MARQASGVRFPGVSSEWGNGSSQGEENCRKCHECQNCQNSKTNASSGGLAQSGSLFPDFCSFAKISRGLEMTRCEKITALSTIEAAATTHIRRILGFAQQRRGPIHHLMSEC